MDQLGQKIRRERKEQGLTMRRLAEKIGVSVMTLQRIEVGKVDPSIELVVAIAHHLKLPLSHFVRDLEPFLYLKRAEDLGDEPEVDSIRLLPPGLIEPGAGMYLLEGGTDGPVSRGAGRGKRCGYVLEGRLKLSYSGREIDLASGDVFAFDSSYDHSLVFTEPGRLVFWQA